jgi:histidinol phosphatase-like enzyme (inositol monophosphatase family)
VSEPRIADLLDVAIIAAEAGGRRTLAHFGTGTAVEWKADQTPVTIADRESEAIMRGIIGKAFPDHAILGEEEGETGGSAPYRWILDPLDGTRTFVRGVPLYGTLVGLEHNDDPIVGVVFLPALGELIAAGRGEGCRWNGRSCQVSSVDRLEDALVTVTDVREAQKRSGGWDRLAARTYMQRTWADCYGYVLLATGRSEIAIDPMMNVWDCAALMPMIEEAGGRFTDWRGRRTIRGGEAVATNGKLHAAALDLLGEPA